MASRDNLGTPGSDVHEHGPAVTGSGRRSTSPSFSSRVTTCVMADWVTCSVAVSSPSRSGLRRASVCSTDNVVKLCRWIDGSRM